MSDTAQIVTTTTVTLPRTMPSREDATVSCELLEAANAKVNLADSVGDYLRAKAAQDQVVEVLANALLVYLADYGIDFANLFSGWSQLDITSDGGWNDGSFIVDIYPHDRRKRTRTLTISRAELLKAFAAG